MPDFDEQRPLVRLSLLMSATNMRTCDVMRPTEPSANIVVGRDSACDVRLQHKTVSRQHIRLTTTNDSIVVFNLSKNGTTIVDGTVVEAQQKVQLPLADFGLQVGAFLVKVEIVQGTVPFADRLFPAGEALVQINERWKTPVKVAGHPLNPGPVQVAALRALCERSDMIVAFDDILRSVDDDYGAFGGGNVNQIITYIRNAFIELLQQGVLTREVLQSASTLDDDELFAESTPYRKLMLALVKNYRGRGYALHLKPGSVFVAPRP